MRHNDVKLKPFDQYQNPAIAIDLVVFGYDQGQLQVLLLNRKDEPFAGRWTLPGAFLQFTETFQQTCRRILDTKLGMSDLYLEQLYSFDQPDRDPRGRVIAVAYYALINPAHYRTAAGTMANDVRWFPIGQLPDPAFDHPLIIEAALKRLQAKILYHPAGFELLDQDFTIAEIQELYECILGRPLDRRNFRRKFLDARYIVPTGAKRGGLKNRHPELYRFNKELPLQKFHLNIELP